MGSGREGTVREQSTWFREDVTRCGRSCLSNLLGFVEDGLGRVNRGRG